MGADRVMAGNGIKVTEAEYQEITANLRESAKPPRNYPKERKSPNPVEGVMVEDMALTLLGILVKLPSKTLRKRALELALRKLEKR